MVRVGTLLVSMVVALLATLVGTFGAWDDGRVEASPASAVPATPVEDDRDIPVPTVSDFFPESNNLSDCVGLVERPGCGSESRGGSGQTLVFIALALGLGVVFWRVSRGVRANRSELEAAQSAPADAPADSD